MPSSRRQRLEQGALQRCTSCPTRINMDRLLVENDSIPIERELENGPYGQADTDAVPTGRVNSSQESEIRSMRNGNETCRPDTYFSLPEIANNLWFFQRVSPLVNFLELFSLKNRQLRMFYCFFGIVRFFSKISSCRERVFSSVILFSAIN